MFSSVGDRWRTLLRDILPVGMLVPGPEWRLSASQEAQFLHEHRQRIRNSRRLTAMAGLGMWCLFMAWDWLPYSNDPAYKAVWPVIFATRAAVLVLRLGIFFVELRTYDDKNRWPDRWVVVGMLVAYGGICVLSVITPSPYGITYFFAGLLLAHFSQFTCYGLLARDAEIYAWGSVFFSLLTVYFVKYTVTPTLTMGWWLNYPLTEGLFLVITAYLGYLFCYLLEGYSRRAFLAHHVAVELKERLRVEAEHRNEEKSRFLANAVHDLKQPVQAIVSVVAPLSDTIHHGQIENSETLLDLMRRAVRLMQEQLTSVLDLSRVESGTMRAQLQATDVRVLLREMQEQLRSLALASGVSLKVEQPIVHQTMAVLTDPIFLRRILTNLANNAIRYREPTRAEGCKVWLRIEDFKSADGFMSLVVSDNGIGIDQSLIDSHAIFRPFFQVHNRFAESDKGAGLGLSIVSGLLRLLPNHRLSVESQLGQGTTFRVTVPRVDAIPSHEVDGWGMDGIEPTALAGVYIVYVEDDDLVRHATKFLLEAAGAVCEAYADFDEFDVAVRALERLPDVIVTDFRLPGNRTGIDIVQSARKHLDASDMPPIVVVSGEAEGWANQFADTDIHAVRKPVSGPFLVRQIREAHEQHIQSNNAREKEGAA